MSSPETGQPAGHQDPNIMDRFRNHKAVLASTVALALGGFAAYEITGGSDSQATAQSGNSGSVPALVSSESQALANCDTFVSSNAGADASRYNPDAFMPNTSVSNVDQAKLYVFNLFNKENGPLAGKGDIAIEAAMMATVGDASHQGGFENTNYDYIDHYNKALAALNGTNGGEVAVADCKELASTLIQDVGFNESWANAGQTISQIAAGRDRNNNHIDNFILNTGVAKVTYKGIEFKLRDTSKGQNGYLSVLITVGTPGVPNGDIFVQGLSKQQVYGVNPKEKGKAPVHPNPHHKNQQNVGKTSSTSSKSHPFQMSSGNGKIVSRSSGGSSTGTFGTSPNKGESNHAGSVHEKGGQQGHRPGNAPSFGPGTGGHRGTSTSPNTTPTTTPNTTPTTTPNTTPTTTPNTTPTTTPNTTPTTTPNTTPTTTPNTTPTTTPTTTTTGNKPTINCDPAIDTNCN